jgi:hypothetical protein
LARIRPDDTFLNVDLLTTFMTHYDEISGRTIKESGYSKKKCDIKIGEDGTFNDLFDSSGNMIPLSKLSERRNLYPKKED